jgi:hypothetical protein
MMTRKDYVATAEILADNREEILMTPEGEVIFGNLVVAFSKMFAEDNERFLADRFEDACWEDED